METVYYWIRVRSRWGHGPYETIGIREEVKSGIYDWSIIGCDEPIEDDRVTIIEQVKVRRESMIYGMRVSLASCRERWSQSTMTIGATGNSWCWRVTSSSPPRSTK